MRLTIRRLVIAGQVVLALLVIGSVALGYSSTNTGASHLRQIYDSRVVPLRELKTISDAYAVFVVDATHKVRNGNWTWAEGEASVVKAKDEIAQGWQRVHGRAGATERPMLAAIEARVLPADTLSRDILTALRGRDVTGLETIVRDRLYQTLDPLTNEIDSLVAALVEATEADYATADAAATTAMRAITALGIVAIILAGAIALLLQLRALAPLAALTHAMRRIADAAYDTPVPGLGRRDELGEMATVLGILRDAGAEAAQLRADQDRLRTEAEASRRSALQDMADGIEAETRATIAVVGETSREIGTEAASVAEATERVGGNAQAVAAAAQQSLANAETVAAAAEELTASIGEITTRVRETASSAQRAAGDCERTETAIAALSDAVTNVGEVVRLISEIAGQTNLLALNATIEAARAGEAGKGFAVVASEVKNLAGQTAKATDDIAGRIEHIRRETNASVEAVRSIIGSVRDVDQLAATIAGAVGQQLNATQEIARTIGETATASREVTERIAEVSANAVQAGSQARRVGERVSSLANSVTQLRQELTRVVRTSVEDVDRRSHTRLPVAMAARFEHERGVSEIQIIDASEGGLAARTEATLTPGMRGTLRLPTGAVASCRCVSAEDGRIGLRFDDPREAESLVGTLMRTQRAKAA